MSETTIHITILVWIIDKTPGFFLIPIFTLSSFFIASLLHRWSESKALLLDTECATSNDLAKQQLLMFQKYTKDTFIVNYTITKCQWGASKIPMWRFQNTNVAFVKASVLSMPFLVSLKKWKLLVIAKNFAQLLQIYRKLLTVSATTIVSLHAYGLDRNAPELIK